MNAIHELQVTEEDLQRMQRETPTTLSLLYPQRSAWNLVCFLKVEYMMRKVKEATENVPESILKTKNGEFCYTE